MSFFSDAQETTDRYGKYMTEFQKLFSKHDVSFGSPEDFFRLAPKLAYDDSFRTDFTVLAKSVGREEEGRLSLPRMLTIVALAMGGREIEHLGSAGAVPVSLTVVFLAGIGGWSEKEPAMVEAAASEVGASGTVNGAGNGTGGWGGAGSGTDAGGLEEEREAMELERRLTSGTDVDLESVAAALFSGPAMLKEALNRLELNTLQLKLHLDSIDSRMERIEPHLDDLAWRFAAREGTPPSVETRPGAASVPDLPEERPLRFATTMRPWGAKEVVGLERSWQEDAPQIEPEPVRRGEYPIRELDREPVRQPGWEPWKPRVAAQEVVPEKVAAPIPVAAPVVAAPVVAAPIAAIATVPVAAALTKDWVKETLVNETAKEPVKELEKEPVKEGVRESAREVVAGRETAQWREDAVPVLLREHVPEPAPEPLSEPAIRVPFGQYLRVEGDEEEEVSESRWGRWVLAALLVVAVAGGGLVYHSYGWRGFADGWQHGKALVGAAIAKGRSALGEAKELPAKPAPSAGDSAAGSEGIAAAPPSAAPQSATPPSAAPQGAASQPSVPAASASVPTGTAVPSPASRPQSGAAGVGAPSGGAVSGGAAGVGSTPARGSAQAKVMPERKRSHVEVVEEETPESRGASTGGGATAATVSSAARVFGGSVAPPFVDASRLTVLSRKQPNYPDDALAQGITGEVVVQALVSSAGTVESAQIVSGPAGLLKASLDAMKGWRYQPYLVNGEPAEVRTFVKFRFIPDE